MSLWFHVPMTNSVVSAKGLYKRFGEHVAVSGVDFDIPAGICFGILGPNGAGKTTLIRMLLGMAPLTSGEYTLFGESAGVAEQRQRVGVVPQMDNLDPDFSVSENLFVYASYFGLSRLQMQGKVNELLSFSELSGRSSSQVANLSGGMRRRLMIARALVNDPDVVVLDEPTTGLDPQARHIIWQRLRELKRSGKTLILTTHYMEEAEQLCDDIMILNQGRIIARGSPRILIGKHVEPEVVELRGEVSQPDVDALLGELNIDYEHVGDSWFCYLDDARPLLERCTGFPKLNFVHRPANLEDVFLKLTGRELSE